MNYNFNYSSQLFIEQVCIDYLLFATHLAWMDVRFSIGDSTSSFM